MTTTTHRPYRPAPPVPGFIRRRRRWFTVLAAMAFATAAWAVAVQLFGVDLVVQSFSGTTRVSSLAVILASLGAGLSGWVLLGLLEKRTPRASLVWRVIAIAIFVVSLLGPLTAVTPAATAVLLGMHVIVAGMLIWGLPRSATYPVRR
jgi:Family of unknown function (DUF6069)